MTFLHDQIRDEYRSQEHSPASITLVAVIMIFIALMALAVVL